MGSNKQQHQASSKSTFSTAEQQEARRSRKTNETAQAPNYRKMSVNPMAVSDATLESIQKCIDHSLRAYFIHTMEKIECLSEQLLQNECTFTKMHLDLIERISKLRGFNPMQEQTVANQLETNMECSCNDEDSDGGDPIFHTCPKCAKFWERQTADAALVPPFREVKSSGPQFQERDLVPEKPSETEISRTEDTINPLTEQLTSAGQNDHFKENEIATVPNNNSQQPHSDHKSDIGTSHVPAQEILSTENESCCGCDKTIRNLNHELRVAKQELEECLYRVRKLNELEQLTITGQSAQGQVNKRSSINESAENTLKSNYNGIRTQNLYPSQPQPELKEESSSRQEGSGTIEKKVDSESELTSVPPKRRSNSSGRNRSSETSDPIKDLYRGQKNKRKSFRH